MKFHETFTSPGESIKVRGRLRIYRNGVLEVDKQNLVVTSGINILVDAIDASGVYPAYCAVGSDGTASTPSMTALGAELFRKAFDTTNRPYPAWQTVTTFAPGEGTGLWEEIGMFTLPVAGAMFNRVVVNFTKLSTDTVIVAFDISFAAS